MNFNFGEVLTRAWQIIWKHKVLWIFGILAGCGRGGSRFNTSSRGGNGGPGQLPPEILRIFETIQQNLTAFLVAGCILLLLIWAVTIFLGTIGRIGLIRGTYSVEAGAETLIFGPLFSESMPYFWRMLGVSLIVAVPFLFVLAALIAGFIAFAISAGNRSDVGAIGVLWMVPVLIGCICLLIPVLFVVGMIIRQAENAIVLENLGVFPSLSRGWEVFRANLGPIILMAIILAVLNLVVGFVIAIPVFIIVFPSVIAFAAGEAKSWTPLVLMTIGLCIYAPVLLVLSGIMNAYLELAWTLTYMRLTEKPQETPLKSLEANA